LDNRGTAPAILYSLMRLRRLDPNGSVAFFPSDHYFSVESLLHAHLDSAFREAELRPKRVILLGISPDAPEADHGWIQPGAPLGRSSIFRVERFWEKPSQAVACALMNLGCLCSFIMVGRIQAFLDLIHRALPKLVRSLWAIASGLAAADQMALNDLYSRIPIVNFSH